MKHVCRWHTSPPDCPPLPRRFALGACGFSVSETADRVIVFREERPICGAAVTLFFSRPDGYWQFAIDFQVFERDLPASRITEALRRCEIWRGKDYEPWGPSERYDAEGITEAEARMREHGREMATAMITARFANEEPPYRESNPEPDRP